MSIFEIRSFLGLAGYYERFENGPKCGSKSGIDQGYAAEA